MSWILKIQFSLGLMKLRIFVLNWTVDSIFRSSSLRLLQSLIYNKEEGWLNWYFCSCRELSTVLLIWATIVWLLKWCKIHSWLIYMFSLILFAFSLILFIFSLTFIFSLFFFIFSHLICILSPYLYSVIIYIFRHLIYVQSHLICIQSHVMNIQSHFICIQSNHICIQSYLIYIQPTFLRSSHQRKRLQHRCFPVNIAKFLEHLFWRTRVGSCFCFLYSPKSYIPCESSSFRGNIALSVIVRGEWQ